MDIRHPYLTKQLIAYIGNKRALLPFLHCVFAELAGGRGSVTFCDPFAGSGAVSRLARLMGFKVLSNDWEYYTFVINSCHLGISVSELPRMFGARGGISSVMQELSTLPSPPEPDRYISRYFAPTHTDTADWRRERLFYTTENALVIDAVRHRIEEVYPGMPSDPKDFKEKMVLLAPLVCEAATHTNTSGVFKAYHHGFGGFGKNALTRIMAPITLRPPVLVDCPFPSQIFQEDAESFLSSHGSDICYLDPPYAVHQYGSNYFMLNTIALWDKPEVSGERTADGVLREKAGIRRDWVKTRSRFCYKATAADAFRSVVRAADCRFLCVSYSNEGLVSPEALADILSETGSLSVRSTPYVKYPGGKQSLGRIAGNTEHLFVVDRRARHGRGVPVSVERHLRLSRLERLLRSSFDPARIGESFATRNGAIVVDVERGASLALPMRDLYRFDVRSLKAARGLADGDMGRFMERLAPCGVRDRRQEIEVLLSILRRGADIGARERYLREIVRLLKCFAHKKYRGIFSEALARLRACGNEGFATESFRNGLAAVEETARKRFGR